MNKGFEITLKGIRKIYTYFSHNDQILPECIKEPEKASQVILKLLTNEQPCMIARFGSTELNAISNYKGIKEYHNDIIGFIKGSSPQWWWNSKGLEEIFSCSGFFPATIENVSIFAKMMIDIMPQVDILGSWRPQELLFQKELRNSQFITLRLLEPFWSKNPWTKALANQKVLVIHPFAETILNQYKKRELLFTNPDILPLFKELHIIKAVQSLGGDDKRFNNWFDALEWMKYKMNQIDYDICLIGCGAYGFPLAAHAKKQGKKAIHLGGSLQLLFGIKGRRWEDPYYGVREWGIPYGRYSSLINEYWVRPDEKERSQNAMQVEGGCYW